MVEHLAQEGEELLGILAEEIERDIALTDVGHALDDDAAEVEELGNGGGLVEGGSLAKERVGGMSLRPQLLIGATGLEGEVEFDQIDIGVGEIKEGVAVGQRMDGRNEGGAVDKL